MNPKDRRVRKTKTQLENGLAGLLREKAINEITVTELTERVDINRSTFYLHYRDIYDMMESIENELVEKIEELIQARPVSPFGENSFPFIEDIFAILAENKAICAALLGPNGDIAFLHRIEAILSKHSLKVLEATSLTGQMTLSTLTLSASPAVSASSRPGWLPPPWKARSIWQS